MFPIFVILDLKTVDYYCKLLDFQNIESLNRKHSELSTDFMDGHYLVPARKLAFFGVADKKTPRSRRERS